MPISTPVMEATACFSIRVEFPETVDDEPVQIDSLLAIVPLFSVTLEDSMDFVNFRSFSLQTAYCPVNMKVYISHFGTRSMSPNQIQVASGRVR